MSSAVPAPPPVPSPRPFSAGSVIGRSFTVWFANFLPFSLVTLAVHAPVLVLAAAMPAEAGPGWGLVVRLLSSLAQLVVTGALTFGVLESLRGGRAPVGALFGTGFRRMGWVFAVSFRVGLWILLGTILLVVPAIVWYCAPFVAVPAGVVETGLGSSADALQRSRDLTRGDRWGIFAVAVVAFLVTLAFLFLVAGGAMAVLVQRLPSPLPVVVATAVVALASSFGACAAAVAYHDLRVAKEGVATADLVRVFE